MTQRWTFHDPITSETFTFAINPNAMTGIGEQRTLTHSRNRYGVTSTEGTKRERELTFSGVVRSQAFYDSLVEWVDKRNAVIVTDHVGRQFRVYLTEFIPTDRSPIPRAPKRWRYTIKSKLLEEL